MPPAQLSPLRALGSTLSDLTNTSPRAPAKAGDVAPAPAGAVPETSCGDNASEVPPAVTADSSQTPRIRLIVKPSRRTLYAAAMRDRNLQNRYFWDPSGTFVFTTDCKVFFCIRLDHILLTYSTILLNDAFVHSEEKRVAVYKDTTSLEWEILLGIVTGIPQAVCEPTLCETTAVIRLADRFRMHSLRMWAEGRLRLDFFYTPDTVRKAFDDRTPNALEAYQEVLAIGERAPLDDHLYTLACYAALLNVNWSEDEERDEFDSKFPNAYTAVRTAQDGMQKRYELFLKEVTQVPGHNHYEDEPIYSYCEASIEYWSPDPHPVDVPGTLDYLYHESNVCGCCPECAEEIMGLVAELNNHFYQELSAYFNLPETYNVNAWQFYTMAPYLFLPTFRF
ncbi:hypothetical protein EXIGLDRAFT_779981 [Exidia glandulosa HHB12029]|uniref:Uncharacterized protein n=1 Tax=Exidia glandulosa HHB12029 TaxID=1314781 RepID=A0A165BT82_EXIGL|nr:hypothetical protein EXIGLDRAFT_779981 [Exidia glandulosa HHB12029]